MDLTEEEDDDEEEEWYDQMERNPNVRNLMLALDLEFEEPI